MPHEKFVKSIKFWFIFMSIIACGYSQVTLSAGWGPGKRSLYTDNSCNMDIKSVMKLCQSLMIKLHELNMCEFITRANYGQPRENEESTDRLYNSPRF